MCAVTMVVDGGGTISREELREAMATADSLYIKSAATQQAATDDGLRAGSLGLSGADGEDIGFNEFVQLLGPHFALSLDD